MRPHYSQSSRENATPSIGTSPLAFYKEVPSPGPKIEAFRYLSCTTMSNCKRQNKRSQFLRKRSWSLDGWTKIFCHRVLAYTRMRYVSCLVPIPLKQMSNFFRENKGNLRGTLGERSVRASPGYWSFLEAFQFENSKSVSNDPYYTTLTAPRFQVISHVNITEFHNHHWTLSETHALTCCCFS